MIDLMNRCEHFRFSGLFLFFIGLLILYFRPVNMSGNQSIIQKVSKNFDDRLIGPPEMIIIHQINQETKDFINFSIHYLICKNGTVNQFVAENRRAWNSGNSYWHGRFLLDDWSISIGLEEETGTQISNEMTSALIALVQGIQSRHSKILNTGIVSYYDVAVQRDNLTIPDIHWAQLALAGVGIMPNEGYGQIKNIPLDTGEMILKAHLFLKEIGYYITSQTSTTEDPAFKSALKAFQAHYLPDHVTGSIDNYTYGILQHVRSMYVSEYAKEWQIRKQNLTFTSNLSINSNYSSSNFNQRLLGPPFVIVIHDTEETFEDSLAILTDPNRESPVSAHYLIDLSGSIYRLVNDTDRAWHAGTSYWHGMKDLNDVAIGIELVNTDSAKNGYPDQQITALIKLLIDIRNRFNIPLHFIISHEDIAPTRRADPGPHFPWQKLVESGLSIDAAGGFSNDTYNNLSHSEYITNIRHMLKEIGYLIEPQNSSTIDKELSDSFRRFQWRFAPAYTNWTVDKIDMVPYEYMLAVRNAYIKSYTRN